MELSIDSKDLPQPTSKHLHLIKWLPGGLRTSRLKKLMIVQKTAYQWRTLATLLGVEPTVIESIANPGSGKTPEQCLSDVFNKYWSSDGSAGTREEYPRTWRGLYTLLEDAELGEVADDLSKALSSEYNSVCGTMPAGYSANARLGNSPTDEASPIATAHEVSTSSIPLLSQQKQMDVLESCSLNIYELLNVDKLLPHLCQENLLNKDEQKLFKQSGIEPEPTRERKITKLVNVLPKQGSDGIRRFVKCLRSSQAGTNQELAALIEGQFSISVTKPINTGYMVLYLFLGVLAVLSVMLLAFLFVYYPGSLNVFNLYQSKSLPYPSKIFVGREQEMLDLSNLLDFSHSDSDVRIVNIVGSPGFGKSTLAIHVGNHLVQHGMVVHYVNLAEYQDQKVQQTLAEKILKAAGKATKMVSFDELLKWLRNLFWNSVIILDNCDDILQSQKVKFFDAIKLLVEQTSSVKVVITSREVTTQIEYFKRYPVYELSTRAACELLNKKLPSGANLTSSEVEEIAKLTGNAPLALQIVGALWTLPNPSNPSLIIEELQQRPIPLLSQDEFEYKINVSIDLSYRYLSFEMQKIGHFLANFPGSFHERAAIFIYVIEPNDFQDLIMISYDVQSPMENTHIITETLDSLIHRSLIEYDSRTKRYQFHRLIKEYFREKEMSVRKIGQNETRRFAVNFHFYYSVQLQSCGSTFKTDYKQALATFHTERHNFQKLLDYLSTGKHQSVDSFLRIVLGLMTATDSGLLRSSFSDEELIHPLQSALKYFDKIVKHLLSKQLTLNESHFNSEQIVSLYISLLYQVSGIEDELFGPQKAMETCQQRKNIVESFNITASSTAAVAYQNFYVRLANYQTALENHVEAVLCQMKSISLRVKDLLSQCLVHSTKCSYYKIGKVLYSMSEYEKAADLFEKSHKHELHLGMEKVYLLFHMIRVYTDLNVQTNVDLYTKEFKEVVQQEMSVSTPSKLFADSVDIQTMISYLRHQEKTEVANVLEGKLLNAIIEIGAQPRVISTPLTTLKVVEHYYRESDYDQTVQLSEFLLKSLRYMCLTQQREKVEDIQLKTQMLIAKARFHSGNYTQGMDDMEGVFQFITMNLEKVAQYRMEFRDACFYLIPRRKYITACYPSVTSVPFDVVKLTLYLLFGIPLDPYSNNDCYEQEVNDANSLPKSLLPEIESRSSSKDVTMTRDYPVQQLVVDMPSSLFEQIKSGIHEQLSLFKKIKSFLLSLLKWCLNTVANCVCFIIQFPSLCFILNILSVFIRLYFALVIGFISCFMFIIPYAIVVRSMIIVPMYRYFFRYPQYFIFPITIFLFNVVFFIDTVVFVFHIACMRFFIYLITGFNFFEIVSVSECWYNGFPYYILVE